MADAFHIYQDVDGEWRWKRVAPNGRIIADSGEGYTRKADVLAAVGREDESPVRVVEDDGGGESDHS